MKEYDLIIVGGGTAGITAAIYAKRAGIQNVLIIEKDLIGGKLNYIDEIENFPGYPLIQGFYLALQMGKQLKEYDIDIRYGEINQVYLSDKIKKLWINDEGYKTRSVIVAVGMIEKRLDCKGSRLIGVSSCEACEGRFYEGKDAVVVGGGNAAYECALYLSRMCKTVTIVIRKDKPKADKMLIDEVGEVRNIGVLFETTVDEILGIGKVKGVILNRKGSIREMQVSCVFVKIGSELAEGPFDELPKQSGFFKWDTGIEGVYVAGDCVHKTLRQLVTAMSDGAQAGILSAKFLLK